MMIALADIALQAGGTDLKRVEACLRQAALVGQSPLRALQDQAEIPEDKLLQHLADAMQWQWLLIPTPCADQAAELKALLPARIALKHRLLPLGILPATASEGFADADAHRTDDRSLLVASADPLDLMARQALARHLPVPVVWAVTPGREILQGLQSFYGVGADTFDDLIQSRDLDATDSHLRDEENILDSDNAEASVLKFVNQIIREALAQRATDIHVEPLFDNLRIRYRVDGVLHEAPVPEKIKTLQASVLARIKVMAKLDIAEKRLPQDGRINLKLEGQNIDVRVACIPSVEGESISLRLLGQERFTLDKLGLAPDYRTKVDALLKKPNGIVLVTGPTGSGKSTTLYTFLSQINSVQRRIVTIEDPVENKLPGVVQIAVKPEINLTFASGLRSILRGDPNVVMVGEIRDLETAEIAVRASLTGHLVFSTLHTNDAVGGITRLIEMGVEPFLVSSSVRAFLAQRLVRSLCVHCRRPIVYTREQLEACGFPCKADSVQLFAVSPTGCQSCRNSGFHGRMAIYEMVIITQAMQDLITRKASTNEFTRQARVDGFISMREYGWQKVREGITTLEEVIRVTSEDI